ncbi:hypothetical protein E2C01_094771 [Portunus trituberculatus]|uniref:Uncharacterized protein n=1 Tax=Portunus trituberculatus TaxID=210409 RepID=A0A5B7JTD6_PORTR|nr:hypothetical protein [Portunus trituberculatus]
MAPPVSNFDLWNTHLSTTTTTTTTTTTCSPPTKVTRTAGDVLSIIGLQKSKEGILEQSAFQNSA